MKHNQLICVANQLTGFFMIRKMHYQKEESYTYSMQKKLVDWMSNVATLKMYILRKTSKLKNIAISYFPTVFHNFALKIEPG